LAKNHRTQAIYETKSHEGEIDKTYIRSHTRAYGWRFYAKERKWARKMTNNKHRKQCKALVRKLLLGKDVVFPKVPHTEGRISC
jgi:hypothetical protein